MALTEIQLKICRLGFMAPLAKKVPDPWTNPIQVWSRLHYAW